MPDRFPVVDLRPIDDQTLLCRAQRAVATRRLALLMKEFKPERKPS